MAKAQLYAQCFPVEPKSQNEGLGSRRYTASKLSSRRGTQRSTGSRHGMTVDVTGLKESAFRRNEFNKSMTAGQSEREVLSPETRPST